MFFYLFEYDDWQCDDLIISQPIGIFVDAISWCYFFGNKRFTIPRGELVFKMCKYQDSLEISIVQAKLFHKTVIQKGTKRIVLSEY